MPESLSETVGLAPGFRSPEATVWCRQTKQGPACSQGCAPFVLSDLVSVVRLEYCCSRALSDVGCVLWLLALVTAAVMRRSLPAVGVCAVLVARALQRNRKRQHRGPWLLKLCLPSWTCFAKIDCLFAEVWVGQTESMGTARVVHTDRYA